MNKNTDYDVLTCAGCLPTTGLDYNLFLKCMPNEQMLVATTFLARDERIEKLEVLASLEEALAELEQEFGPLPEKDG